MSTASYRYEVARRPLDGWWSLMVWKDDQVVMHGVYEPTDEGWQAATDDAEAYLATRADS